MEEIIDVLISKFFIIIGSILSICVGGYITWRHFTKTKKFEAIEKFRQVFIGEREKIKRFNSQDYTIQERAIFEVKRYLNFWESFRLIKMYENFKHTEEKYRQVERHRQEPFCDSFIIMYGDHKNKLLNKIDKIINYLN